VAAILDLRPAGRVEAAFARLSDTAPGRIGLAGYVVRDHVVLEPDQPLLGALTMYAIGRRNPDLSFEQAAAYWRDVHAPLAVRHHIGMARYVQNLVVGRLGAAVPDVDLIAELSFARTEDFLERFYDSADGRRTIAADAANFAGGGDTHFCFEMRAG
jgi:uncharacterized protein (TIGR02118 family)